MSEPAFDFGGEIVCGPRRRSSRSRQNRLGVGAAAAVLLAILAGAGVAVWQARVALAEQRRAEEVKAFIASIFRDADPYEGKGRDLSAIDLLKQAKDRIDRLSRQNPELRVQLLNLVGQSLLGLGAGEAAQGVARQVGKEAMEALGPDHPQTVEARLLLADVYLSPGQTTDMREGLEALMPVVRRSAKARPEDLGRTLKAQVDLAIDDGRKEEAPALARDALGDCNIGVWSSACIDPGAL